MVDRSKFKRLDGSKISTSDLIGEWVNELGSLMRVEAVSGSDFEGTFTSGVSDVGDPTDGPLRGTLASESISFTVNWMPRFVSVTAWTGLVLHDDAGNLLIYALWHLANGIEPEQQWWEHVNAGADLFVRVTP